MKNTFISKKSDWLAEFISFLNRIWLIIPPVLQLSSSWPAICTEDLALYTHTHSHKFLRIIVVLVGLLCCIIQDKETMLKTSELTGIWGQ